MNQTNFAGHIRRAMKAAEAQSAEQVARGGYDGLNHAADLLKADRLSAFVAALSGCVAADDPELSADLMEFLRRGRAAGQAVEAGK